MILIWAAINTILLIFCSQTSDQNQTYIPGASSNIIIIIIVIVNKIKLLMNSGDFSYEDPIPEIDLALVICQTFCVIYVD